MDARTPMEIEERSAVRKLQDAALAGLIDARELDSLTPHEVASVLEDLEQHEASVLAGLEG